MADQNLDTRRMARDQESRITAATAIGLNTVKPMIQFQVPLLRLWADSIESLAQNYEKGLETASSAVEQRWQQQHAA